MDIYDPDEIYDEGQAAAREQDDLFWRNRRVVAERAGWPVGVLEMCEHLDAVYPGWSVWWRPENTCAGWEHPAGYLASRDPSGSVCGVDPAALEAAIAKAPAERHWHFRPVCCALHPAPA